MCSNIAKKNGGFGTNDYKYAKEFGIPDFV